jgi:hypothetical protein
MKSSSTDLQVFSAKSSERNYNQSNYEFHEPTVDLKEEVKKLLGENADPHELEELEAVLYSITSGKIHIGKKAHYHAHSAAINSMYQVPLVLEYMQRKQDQRIKTKVHAY